MKARVKAAVFLVVVALSPLGGGCTSHEGDSRTVGKAEAVERPACCEAVGPCSVSQAQLAQRAREYAGCRVRVSGRLEASGGGWVLVPHSEDLSGEFELELESSWGEFTGITSGTKADVVGVYQLAEDDPAGGGEIDVERHGLNPAGVSRAPEAGGGFEQLGL